MTVAGATAGRVGSDPTDGAIHQGTTPGSLDTSQGLVSAEGGEVLHPLEFAGSEVTPTPNSSGVALEEPNAGPGPPTTVWMSLPSNLGYTRSTSGSTGAETPSQDSGTSNGSSQDELTRVKNFNGGATQNPTSDQAATTSRAQQRGAGGGGGNGAAGAGGTGGGPAGPWWNPNGYAPGTQLGPMAYVGSDQAAHFNDPFIEGVNTLGGLLGGGPVYDTGTRHATGPYDTGGRPPAAQAPAPAATNDNSLTFQDFVNNPRPFLTSLAKGLAVALVMTVAVGGFLVVAGAAGPVAAGVALFAGAILLAVGLYSMYQQYNTISTGFDASGTPVSKEERVAMTGDLLGQIVGALLGGRALKGLNDIVPSNWAARVDSWWKGGPETPVEVPAAPEPAPGECTGDECFPAGTLVATADGPKAIERIKANERVWAYDVATATWRLCRVIEPLNRFHAGDYIRIGLERETIESTGGHPFWVVSGEALAERPETAHVPEFAPGAATPGRWVERRATSALAMCSCNAPASGSQSRASGPTTSAWRFTTSGWPSSRHTPSGSARF